MSSKEKVDWRANELTGIAIPDMVSSLSKWDDKQWTFDHPNLDTIPANRRIVWSILLEDGTLLTDECHAGFLEVIKRFTWSMRVAPPNGRLPQKFSSLMKTGDYALMLARWMISERITRFSDLSPDDISRYIAVVRTRKGRSGGCIGEYTVGCIARVVEDIYFQRNLLDDAILEAPFAKGNQPSDIMNGRVIVSIQQIPDAVARELLTEAENWIRHGSAVANFYNSFQTHREAIVESAEFAWVKNKRKRMDLEGQLAWTYSRDECVSDWPEHCTITSQRELARALRHLVAACYIITALLTGMRVSEMFSIRRSWLSRVRHTSSDRIYTYINSDQHKIRGGDKGEPTIWVAPPLAIEALECLSVATSSMQRISKHEQLFLTRYGLRGKIGGIEKRDFEVQLNKFAEETGVLVRARMTWTIKTHQFRKTFARFIARRDHTDLLALSTHFKHVSMAMTDTSYVGNDFALEELIDEEIEALVFDAVQSMTSGEPLAGKMGQRVFKRLEFLGRAGSQVRKDFSKVILEESALTLIPDVFGDCVFMADTALCQGKDEKRGLATCIDCSNMLVRQEHRSFWVDYVKRCENLIRMAVSPIAVAPLRIRLVKAKQILKDLGA